MVGNTSPLTRHFCNMLVLSSYLIWIMFIHVKFITTFKSCANKVTVRGFSSDGVELLWKRLVFKLRWNIFIASQFLFFYWNPKRCWCENRDSIFIMGLGTYCKQDVVDQNGDVSERERDCFFSFVASAENHQFLNSLYASWWNNG